MRLVLVGMGRGWITLGRRNGWSLPRDESAPRTLEGCSSPVISARRGSLSPRWASSSASPVSSSGFLRSNRNPNAHPPQSAYRSRAHPWWCTAHQDRPHKSTQFITQQAPETRDLHQWTGRNLSQLGCYPSFFVINPSFIEMHRLVLVFLLKMRLLFQNIGQFTS